jgi:hypothetical protein
VISYGLKQPKSQNFWDFGCAVQANIGPVVDVPREGGLAMQSDYGDDLRHPEDSWFGGRTSHPERLSG